MNELQRLSTQAQVSPIMRTNNGLTLSREGRQLQAALRQVAADGMVKAAEVEVATEIAIRAMEGVKDVDEHRRRLAGSDQGLNMALAEVEMTYINRINRIQRGSAF